MVYFILVSFCLFQLSSQTKELKIISNSEAKTVGDALYVLWSVNSGTLPGNVSGPIDFRVRYCPLNMFQELYCQQVNITLCNATYQRLPYLSVNISTQQDELTDYIRVGHPLSLFVKNSSASTSANWNETSAEFMCIVHNIDECLAAHDGPLSEFIGQVLITASYGINKEEKILDVKQNQEPSQNLNQPNNIVLHQNGRNTVTVKWKACIYDNPAGFNISFYDDGGKILKCGQKVIPENCYLVCNLECKCVFAYLRPYTNYTVSIYSYTGLGHKYRSVSGLKMLRTAEQAPSLCPSFECLICNEDILDNDNRVVNVRWKLPPENTLNGMVRQTRLKYWGKGDNMTTVIIYHNMTTEGSIKLKVNMEYFVQVEICTLEHLCSGCKPKLISKHAPEEHVTTSVNSKILVIGLIGCLCFFIVLVLFGGVLRKQKQEERKPKNNGLEDLKLPDNIEGSISENSNSNVNSGFPRKDSSASSEYHELPPDIPEVEKNEA